MMTAEPSPNDSVAKVLKLGVAVSFGLMAAGVIWSLFAPMHAGAGRLMLAGLLATMATPVARLVMLTVHYGRIGERRYAWLSAGVISVIAGSIALSLFQFGTR